MPVTDWSGFEDARETGWHRKLHIFTDPFYYVEYGIALVGALQIWRNSLRDPQAAREPCRSFSSWPVSTSALTQRSSMSW